MFDGADGHEAIGGDGVIELHGVLIADGHCLLPVAGRGDAYECDRCGIFYARPYLEDPTGSQCSGDKDWTVRRV